MYYVLFVVQISRNVNTILRNYDFDGGMYVRLENADEYGSMDDNNLAINTSQPDETRT